MFERMLLVTPLLLLSCTGGEASKENEAEEQSSALTSYPPVGGQGIALELDLDASNSFFSFTGTTVELGEGIVVTEVIVDDGWNARAKIMIDDTASLGSRDVVVSSGGRGYTIPNGFEVISDSFIIDPPDGKMGEVVEVGLLGKGTEWQAGVTWPNFGDGIEVLEFTVLSETLSEALISIEPDASPGWRNVTVDSGMQDYVVLYDGFKVDRVGLGASFEPSSAQQGDMIEFTIRARGTDFTGSEPILTFYDRFGPNPDIVVNDVTVLDAENLFGRMTLSNAAALGLRDVQIDTVNDSVRIPNAFEVLGGDWDLSEVAISLAFNVVRSLDPSTCQVSESVTATALFFIPLNPPCGGGGMGSPPPSPQPYDNNGIFPDPDGSGSEAEDCPFPTTLPAGDFVWFESEANIVTLEKTYESASGTIYYEGKNLTMADYAAGYDYDLHTQGEEGGLGEYLLEKVQPTVPADWTWVTPDLCGLVHSREEQLDLGWTPAQTYPDAIFFVKVAGTIEAEDKGGYAGVIPWDDGEHFFSPNELLQLKPEPVGFQAYSYIEGPTFGLPESIYQDNQSESYILYNANFTLE